MSVVRVRCRGAVNLAVSLKEGGWSRRLIIEPVAGDREELAKPGKRMTTHAVDADVHAREVAFHDALAETLGHGDLAFRAPDGLEHALLRELGPIEGKTILDLGCGAGELSGYLARRGAHVVSLDISPGMVELARRRLAHAGIPGGEFVVAPAERTPLGDESVDLVVGKWILHHIDVAAAATEVARVLRPGGRAVFIENSGDNRLLSYARKELAGRLGIPRYGTDDEHPLGKEEYELLGQSFAHVTLEYPDFCFFALFDRQIFRLKYPVVTRLLRDIDDVVFRKLPRLRRYSYHVIIGLESAAH